VYFYEAAAANPDRAPLERIRRGRLLPDLGGPALHPSAGACVIGARRFLIAFNVNLKTAELSIADAIARKIRASSGGLPALKALGMRLESQGIVQVSMNLTDYEQTPLNVALEAVESEAKNLGAETAGIELIGLVPRKAFEEAAAHDLRWTQFDHLILEDRLAAAGTIK
jgi:glutamate formiminotransferase